MLGLGILASHKGTNLQAIIAACADGRLTSNIRVVISNNARSGALAKAKRSNILACHMSSKTHPDSAALDRAIRDKLSSCGVDLVLLAGYMKKLGPMTVELYKNRVLNSHPSILPRFGGQGMFGSRVHKAVIDAGMQVTGVTIHMVDNQYDHGPVVAQCRVPVETNDTIDLLEERVQARERLFWVEVLRMIEKEEIDLTGLGNRR